MGYSTKLSTKSYLFFWQNKRSHTTFRLNKHNNSDPSLNMLNFNTTLNSNIIPSALADVKLNVDNPEDNNYFIDLILKFNLNKDHFIIKINHELDEFILDADRAFYYVESKFPEIVDYMNRHSKERILGLILMDRILHMLPNAMYHMESSLDSFVNLLRYGNKFKNVDEIAKTVNETLEFAKRIECVRDSVTHFKRKLKKYVKRHGGDYRFNEEYNPFLKEGGEKLFN